MFLEIKDNKRWRVCKIFRYIKNKPLEIIKREKDYRKLCRVCKEQGRRIIEVKRRGGKIEVTIARDS